MDPSLLIALVLIVAGFLALELKITSAITEVAAGALIVYFFHENAAELGWLKFMAQFGLLGLMFMAGFEVDVNKLHATWKPSVGVGLLSFFVPLAGIYAFFRFFMEMPHLQSGLLAAGLSTTSLALVYHSLKERGLLEEEAGQVLLGAASVVDVLSMVFLALLLGDVGWGTGAFLLFAVPAVWGLPHIGGWIFRRYRGNVVEFELRFLLMVLVAMGALAERVGVHSAIIAFTVGLVLSEVVEDHEVLEEKLKGVVFSFFAPIFFLHAGTRLDLGAVDASAFGTAALILVLACGLKYAGTFAGVRLFTKTMGHFAGLLFNYRLTFGIIVATIGLDTGLLDERLFSVVLLVILGSAAIPVIFLKDRPFELDR